MTIVSQKSKQEIPAGQIESEVLPAEDTIVSVGANYNFPGGVSEFSLKVVTTFSQFFAKGVRDDVGCIHRK